LDCGIDAGDVAVQLGLGCLQFNGKYNQKHHNLRKISFERAEIYEILIFETKKRLNDISRDENGLNKLRQAKTSSNFNSNRYILSELKNSWSKIIYED
jgi:hypothetical protein